MSTINTRLVNYIDHHSSIIKLIIASDGMITSANTYAEQLAGKPLLNTYIKDFFTEFNAKLDSEKILQTEVKDLLLNVNTHRKLPETFYFTSFKTPEGIMLIGESNKDELDEMRSKMIDLNNELNNLARELQKKNIQLDQVNQLKNQFLGMAAHDLRNPIASIFLFSQFVLESDDYEISDDLRKIMELIMSSTEFMLKVLEELLDVVKIESGKLQLNLEYVCFEDLLRKSVEINALLAAKKKIKIVLNIPQSLPEIAFDPTKIEQVLNNLISNAIKYSFSGTTITVSAFSTEQHVLTSVRDEGQGIPDSELDKIFIPFSKISVKSTDGEKSTGLGLCIVKRIITGHQGRIWVESKVGLGSRFYFTIPLNLKS